QVGVDEEVRQLLDLKGLAAQRDLGLPKGQNQHNIGLLKSQRNSGDGAAATTTNNGAASAAEVDAGHQSGVGGKVSLVKTQEEREKMLEAVKSHHSHLDEPVMPDGELLRQGASSQVERHQELDQPEITHHQLQLDLPSKGIQETLYDQDVRGPLLHDDTKLQNPHVRYTPLDLALYVYKTGDEEGVTLAIQELIAEGLMTAEEALNYLHDIRDHLRYLNQQDNHHNKDSQSDYKILSKKNGPPLSLTEMNLGDPEGILTPEMDYESIMEKLKNEDYIYTEYSLEEVIYQLAKILFKQAMHREGDLGSEKALQEVAALLEKEAARGAITPEVEKKVLDVMVNSLVDSLSEKEFQADPGSMIGGLYFKPASESSFPVGNSPMIAGSNFKPSSEMFHLSKATTKREAPDDKKEVAEKKD
ncbi:hypothetical protein OTU49_009825, partial [Cherax quadricarinatus]